MDMDLGILPVAIKIGYATYINNLNIFHSIIMFALTCH